MNERGDLRIRIEICLRVIDAPAEDVVYLEDHYDLILPDTEKAAVSWCGTDDEPGEKVMVIPPQSLVRRVAFVVGLAALLWFVAFGVWWWLHLVGTAIGVLLWILVNAS